MRESHTPHRPLQASCPDCWKTPELCICAEKPVIHSPVRFLILQHPREAREPLGSARLLSLAAPNTIHKVGLSWRSLRHALGEEASPREWGVLFVGTQKGAKKAPPPGNLKGVVLLDGNWKQSKTLWWRNPWLLRLQRVVLQPQEGSHYGTLRRQPRAGCLSTLEAAAEVLSERGETAGSEALLKYFDRFLDRARDSRHSPQT